MKKTPDSGFTLPEVLVALALMALVITLVVPPLLRITGEHRVYLAANELVGVLRLAKTYAIRHGANAAVKFHVTPGHTVTFAIYRDGDGDGVRNKDITTGVDPQMTPARPLAYLGHHVRFGFPPGRPPRDPGNPRRRLKRLHDPIRFNRSDLASFSPLGGATPGSLYVTDGQGHLAVVRVFNRSGKVRILRYDQTTERWR